MVKKNLINLEIKVSVDCISLSPSSCFISSLRSEETVEQSCDNPQAFAGGERRKLVIGAMT